MLRKGIYADYFFPNKQMMQWPALLLGWFCCTIYPGTSSSSSKLFTKAYSRWNRCWFNKSIERNTVWTKRL